MSPMAATIFTKKCDENSVLLFHLSASLHLIIPNRLDRRVSIFSAQRPEREKYFSNSSRKKPQTLWLTQGTSFCPLYGYKYSIFLWVTCSYRKECSLLSSPHLWAIKKLVDSLCRIQPVFFTYLLVPRRWTMTIRYGFTLPSPATHPW